MKLVETFIKAFNLVSPIKSTRTTTNDKGKQVKEDYFTDEKITFTDGESVHELVSYRVDSEGNQTGKQITHHNGVLALFNLIFEMITKDKGTSLESVQLFKRFIDSYAIKNNKDNNKTNALGNDLLNALTSNINKLVRVASPDNPFGNIVRIDNKNLSIYKSVRNELEQNEEIINKILNTKSKCAKKGEDKFTEHRIMYMQMFENWVSPIIDNHLTEVNLSELLQDKEVIKKIVTQKES